MRRAFVGDINLGTSTLPDGVPPDSGRGLLVEAHLIGFEGDLYGRKIEVALHGYIREEKKFDGVDALAAEMREDEAAARRLLALPSP